MSKSTKNLLMTDYKARLGDTRDAMVISLRGVKGTDTSRLRVGLARKKIRITVVRNNLARRSIKGTGLEQLGQFLEGSSALAYGGQSVVEVAREIIALIPQMPGIELKGAILDGQVFPGKAGVEELSKFPTRDEALGRVVSLIVGPARKLVAQVQGPGSTVAGIIKAIEQKLEKGEAISKKAG